MKRKLNKEKERNAKRQKGEIIDLTDDEPIPSTSNAIDSSVRVSTALSSPTITMPNDHNSPDPSNVDIENASDSIYNDSLLEQVAAEIVNNPDEFAAFVSALGCN